MFSVRYQVSVAVGYGNVQKVANQNTPGHATQFLSVGYIETLPGVELRFRCLREKQLLPQEGQSDQNRKESTFSEKH